MMAWAPRDVRGVRDVRDVRVFRKDGRRHHQAPRGGSRPLQALAAAAKEKQPETHDAQHLSRVTPVTRVRISMRDRGGNRDKKCRIPLAARRGAVLALLFTNRGCGW
ncbi:hypothetical protein GCM10023323_03980 [Streptomyces thinghirensis]|uniref:Uncharacterized protein n=1 Tax=Streptomyces thinghirensis TaxID=551547 RepID=A0ABP9SYC4_9ACTN